MTFIQSSDYIMLQNAKHVTTFKDLFSIRNWLIDWPALKCMELIQLQPSKILKLVARKVYRRYQSEAETKTNVSIMLILVCGHCSMIIVKEECYF